MQEKQKHHKYNHLMCIQKAHDNAKIASQDKFCQEKIIKQFRVWIELLTLAPGSPGSPGRPGSPPAPFGPDNPATPRSPGAPYKNPRKLIRVQMSENNLHKVTSSNTYDSWCKKCVCYFYPP